MMDVAPMTTMARATRGTRYTSTPRVCVRLRATAYAMMMDARGRTKRARAEDAAGGANDAGFEDAAVDDDDDDAVDAAVEALGATRASNARGDEAAEGERARGDAAARSVDGTPGTRNAPSNTRDMRAHFRKAKPLGEEDVATLDEAGRRRALARWNARLRVLKKKIRDASAQYPTSSLVLVFTKPFRSRARSDRWCVQSARRARRRARH